MPNSIVSTKRINNLKAFIKKFNKTKMVYLQCPGCLAQYFRRLEWPLLYTHFAAEFTLSVFASVIASAATAENDKVT